ncbi:MAG: heme-binding domain-containing protein [Chitinophagaceae bacterium]|nr:heme-binding domain-containing protein [Chitinophagaceae bacterium]MDP1764278.1 heme-binding domain-containing protein [Sediminibacterium sp.]MDP1810437.1 heme-binding domain-containing protein [Sediminibacterium sp.]MDP3129070.1 heme-binding domain-containing protein [Sediminibacterium sp.]MDP3665112.1 heme-binding domain-containing protein [Sediminibacterium sp.]
MSLAKKTGWGIIVAGIAIQFIQPARNTSGQVLPTEIASIAPIPVNVLALLKSACYDCHSNNTYYPWYANVQPIGWILNNHIQTGKKELNFSDFGSYSLRRQQSKLKSIASQITDGAMPLISYTLLHKNAQLTKDDKALILNWIQQSIDSVFTRN